MAANNSTAEEQPIVGSSGAIRQGIFSVSAGVDALKRHGAPLGLALLFGATLRLLWAGDTSFLGDQAELLSLGHSALDHHAFIITGILSSIGTLNPPISAWLYAPFALFGANGPLAATVFTALLNILAIALMYGAVARYGGRRAGFVASMLYATASAPVYYSRFIWQQNMLPPFLLLFLWAILAGAVEGKRGWLPWAALWWGIAFQLHPTSAALLAPLALALALTWRALRWRDIAWTVGALALIFVPTLIWEAASHGADLTALKAIIGGQSGFDTKFFQFYAQLLSPIPADFFGGGSSYVSFARNLAVVGWLMVGLALFSGAWLVYMVCADWAREIRQRGLAGLLGEWQAAIREPRWRVAALLLVWQLAFLGLFVHHAHKFPIHYLLALLPIIYVSIGLWAAAAARWAEGWLAGRAARWAGALQPALIALTLVIALMQTIGTLGQLSDIHSGDYSGVSGMYHYGATLASQLRTLESAERVATRANANLAVASTVLQLESLGYLAQTDGSGASVYASDGCILAPSATSARSLVTLAMPGTLAYSELEMLNGASALGNIPAQGSQPFKLYHLTPGAGLTNQKRSPANGAQPAVTGYGLTQDASGATYLNVRWSGAPNLNVSGQQRASYWYGASPNGPMTVNYVIQAQQLDATGNQVGSPLETTCGRVAWGSGIDMLAWLPLPSNLADAHGKWRITLIAAPLTAVRPKLGPLSLETGDVKFGQEIHLGKPTTILL